MSTRPLYLILLLCLFSNISQAALPLPIDYDIIYVRYPAVDPKSPYVTIPQGEKPYPIRTGADLMLLSANGEERVLVDCKGCSVMDPMMSFDGKTVYYSLNKWENKKLFSWIYKMHLVGDNAFKPIRLTFNDGFDSRLYKANNTVQHDQASRFGLRDMAPVPLSNGRLLFVSNRAGLTALDHIGHDPDEKGSVQQLYVMDDHEGEKNTKYLASIERLEAGTLHLAQHPMQLQDGRILFSSWQDVGDRYNYAMTNLFTVHPDGSNLKQFTEPHDRNKFLDHFITQLSNGSVVSAYYYPSFDYGYGVLWRAPIDPPGPDFIKFSPKAPKHIKNHPDIRRWFDRKGSVIITPHSTPKDVPASSGKYSMPSAGPNNDLLVAYSTGTVNHFSAVCSKNNRCESLKSGIYLIPNGDKAIVRSPRQLVKLIDTPEYNEIWPRAVLPYHKIYGLEKPLLLDDVRKIRQDSRIIKAQAAGIVGSSSTYNRETSGGDPFQSNQNREMHSGSWTIKGAEAGLFSNKDIYAIRIIGTPPKPFTKPIDKYHKNDKERWGTGKKYVGRNYDRIVERYGAYHHERWEILGEFPLNYKRVIDDQGNPDSSWAAKMPSETPFLIQALDENGMTLISELTWRALKSGEVRTDCGGCHAHTIEPLAFDSTFAGMRVPIQGVKGTDANSPGLTAGLWDLTTGKIPLLDREGVRYVDKNVVGVEFNRDVKPVLQKRCASCHTKKGSAPTLILDSSKGTDVWSQISNTKRPDGKVYVKPQRSKYIRVPQARQSLLAWVAYGKRLDGRNNSSREDDVDYPSNHPFFYISDEEKRTIARWIDLGGPIDFPQTDGMGYTDDNQLPVLNLLVEKIYGLGYSINVGAFDVHSNVNWDSLKVSVKRINKASSGDNDTWTLDSLKDEKFKPLEADEYNFKDGVVNYFFVKEAAESEYIIKAEVLDLIGNKQVSSYCLCDI